MQQFPLLLDGAVRLTQCSEHKIGMGLRHLEILLLSAFLGFVVMYNYFGRCADSYLICLRFLSSYGVQCMSHMSQALFRFAMLLFLFLLSGGCVKLSTQFGQNAL